jgi:hypothetical protein
MQKNYLIKKLLSIKLKGVGKRLFPTPISNVDYNSNPHY